jgi:glycine oxidase
MKKLSADVVIIGGGVIGCAIARELARRGVQVMVLERDSPGRGATWAAAGMLSPLGEAGEEGPFLELSDESLTRYEAFARALHEETNIDVEYRTSGKLHVSLGDEDDRLRAFAADASLQRFGLSLLSADTAREMEPALSEQVTSALFIARDHRVNNRLLGQALHAAATAAGATFRNNRTVSAVTANGNRVTGVRVANGEDIAAPTVVLAAGAWSAQLDGLPRALPIRPLKGQMFAVDGRARASTVEVSRVIYSARCYIIPRDDGRLLVGATVEDVGFSIGPTPRGITSLADAASAVLPMIAQLPLLETWAGFRPAAPDGMPILGPDPDLHGLVYATGHFRNGILLTPITGEIIADAITAARPALDITPFQITRFIS